MENFKESLEDYIGTEMEILDDDGKVYKTITIKNIKDTSENKDGSEFCVTDEDGNIYLYDELNIRYRLSPEAILYDSLIREYNLFSSFGFDYNRMHRVFEDFMNEMVKSDYIKEKQ